MSTGSSGFLDESDLPKLYNVVQSNFIRYSVDIVIAGLREFFRKDSLYHWVPDAWGFNHTVDHTDLPQDAGLKDDLTTRVFIGRPNRMDVIYYPAITAKFGGSRQVPIGLNRDRGRVDYETLTYEDDLGNRVLVQSPSHFVISFAVEGSILIDIYARGIRECEDLAQLVTIFFADLQWNENFKSGFSVKPTINVGAFQNTTDDRNDKLFRQTITLEYRTEYRREIPVNGIINSINFCIDFADDLKKVEPNMAPNIEINTSIQLLDVLNEL